MYLFDIVPVFFISFYVEVNLLISFDIYKTRYGSNSMVTYQWPEE